MFYTHPNSYLHFIVRLNKKSTALSKIHFIMTWSYLLDLRPTIKSCSDLGKTPTETFKMMHTTTQHKHATRALVFRWHTWFSDGRSSLEDDTGRGRNRKVDSNVKTTIRDALDVDRHLTVPTLAAMANVSVGTVYTIST